MASATAGAVVELDSASADMADAEEIVVALSEGA